MIFVYLKKMIQRKVIAMPSDSCEFDLVLFVLSLCIFVVGCLVGVIVYCRRKIKELLLTLEQFRSEIARLKKLASDRFEKSESKSNEIASLKKTVAQLKSVQIKSFLDSDIPIDELVAESNRRVEERYSE